jgi:hypothetical protein
MLNCRLKYTCVYEIDYKNLLQITLVKPVPKLSVFFVCIYMYIATFSL